MATHEEHPLSPGHRLSAQRSLALLVLLGFCPYTVAAVSQFPLFLSTQSQPNTLVILDNSNSMDEAPSGSAVGSNNAASKSEIARSVIKQLITSYTGQINMGLMSYKQTNVINNFLHNSTYDSSYNSSNYNPNFTGARDSLTKRYRIPNPTSPGNYIYYNVALPQYSSTNNGSGFCYSLTAKAFNNGEDPTNGPWDDYRCFSKKVGSSDTLPTTWTTNNQITLQEALLGYSSFLGSIFTFSPTDSDLAQGIVDFGKINTWYYVAPTYFAATSPGRGFLNIPIKALDATQATALNTVLACNIPGATAPCTANGIKNAGLTPIEGTLLTAKDYFNGTLSNTTEGYTASGTKQTYPLPTSCGKNFAILVTDGLPSTTKDGVNIADPTSAIAAAAKAASDLKAAGVTTYVVGFALPYGTDPNTLNTIASAGGSNTAYLASDFATLSSALNTIFANILSKSNSGSSAVSNSTTRLDTGTKVYQARFDATDWSGHLSAYSVGSTGGLTSDWDAATLIPAYNNRIIYTYNPNATAGQRGMLFQWTNLTTTPTGSSQRDYLNTVLGVNDSNGALRVNWLQGDSSKEKKNSGGIFRNRTSVLGDIVDSSPVFVGTEDYGYGSLASIGASYTTFRSSSNYKNRRPMIYTGANDGMLHGFDASLTNGGKEIFAYIPNAVFPNLSKLTAPSYVHQFYVDGSPSVGDIYDGSKWHTLLVGTTAAGGRAIFALDVTNPDGFDTTSPWWEFTNANDADLGYTFAQPSVVRLQDGKWAVIIGNGYESDNGHAVLFVLDALTGAILQKIDTGSGNTTTKNGLSTPLAIDTDGDSGVDTVYAGDLYGNLWKFNLKTSAGSWSTPTSPLFVACATSGINCSTTDRQPITSKPNIGAIGNSQDGIGRMVYFGTGKYFDITDNVVGSNPQIQTFYGLWDKGATITDRASLQDQTIDYEGFGTTVCASGTGTCPTTNAIRVVSKNPVCYSATSQGCTASSTLKNGWALNLISKTDNIAKSERVISFPLMRRGLVVFATSTPSADACKANGTSSLMELDALSGGEYSKAPFDVNGNGKVDATDTVTVNGVSHFAAGLDIGIGMIKTPAVIESDSDHVDYKYASGSSGNMGTVVDVGSPMPSLMNGSWGGTRKSWRQLQ